MYSHHRPNMALGDITPEQKLALAAYLYFWCTQKMATTKV